MIFFLKDSASALNLSMSLIGFVALLNSLRVHTTKCQLQEVSPVTFCTAENVYPLQINRLPSEHKIIIERPLRRVLKNRVNIFVREKRLQKVNDVVYVTSGLC